MPIEVLFYVSYPSFCSVLYRAQFRDLKSRGCLRTLSGIGLGLTRLLLTRPNTTVIATIRTIATPAPLLHSLTTAFNSTLIILPLKAGSVSSAQSLITTLKEDYSAITKVEVVIANAGTSAFTPTLQTGVNEMETHFKVNTMGPILLFQKLYDLLAAAQNPKFILISSVLGSIGGFVYFFMVYI